MKDAHFCTLHRITSVIGVRAENRLTSHNKGHNTLKLDNGSVLVYVYSETQTVFVRSLCSRRQCINFLRIIFNKLIKKFTSN